MARARNGAWNHKQSFLHPFDIIQVPTPPEDLLPIGRGGYVVGVADELDRIVLPKLCVCRVVAQHRIHHLQTPRAAQRGQRVCARWRGVPRGCDCGVKRL